MSRTSPRTGERRLGGDSALAFPGAADDRSATPVAGPPLVILARWILLGVCIVALAAGAGYGLSVIQAPVYGAETDVLYRVADGSGGRAERDLATQQVILQGRSVLEGLAADAGMAVEDLEDQVSVDILGQSDVLRITVAHAEASQALELARAISERYVQTVTDAPAADSDTATFVEATIEDLVDDLAGIEDELADLVAQREATAEEEGGSPAEERLQAEAQELESQISGLRALLAGSAVAPTDAEVRVITPAYLLEDPLSPQPLRAGVAGGMAGLLVVGAIGAALARRWGFM